MWYQVLWVGLVFTSVCLAQIQPIVTDNQGEGKVDWGSRILIATGLGATNPGLPETAQKPAATRAAQQVASRNALETTKGMYLNASTTVRNHMVETESINSSVSGMLKKFDQGGTVREMADGSVEVTVRVPIDGVGGLGELLLGNAIGVLPAIRSFEGRKAEKEVVFSGLVIDCRGLGVKPSLSPRVLDESGKEVYGSAYVTREWATTHGIVGYSRDLKNAVMLQRAGTTPGQIKAVKCHGENSTDVVISNANAANIRSSSQNLKFLSQCRVIFVID